MVYIQSWAGLRNLGFQSVARWMTMRDADAGHNSLVCLSMKPVSQRAQPKTKSLNDTCKIHPLAVLPVSWGNHCKSQALTFVPFPCHLDFLCLLHFCLFRHYSVWPSPLHRKSCLGINFTQLGKRKVGETGQRECKPSAIAFIHFPSRQVKDQFLYVVFEVQCTRADLNLTTVKLFWGKLLFWCWFIL